MATRELTMEARGRDTVIEEAPARAAAARRLEDRDRGAADVCYKEVAGVVSAIRPTE